MIWLALPSPSGSPTTSVVPTSRMMSSAMASGSVKILGISIPAGQDRQLLSAIAQQSRTELPLRAVIQKCARHATHAAM